ncbi:hypothetical protein LCGC14_0627780 [marine sediment metagenome]|uniref:Uncharacterized protein n=1 Tax=marine sediment metagenome TaxID=412755 RepID=A0A0F9UBC2_9ZZZZ
MVWSSTKIKIGWGLFCLVVGAGSAIGAMYQLGWSINNAYPVIPILLLGLLALLPSESQSKAGITKESLKAEFGIKDIVMEKGIIAENVIVNGDLEYKLIETDGGYTNKRIYKMVKKHWQDVQGKSVVIRVEAPNINRGVAFNEFGLYVATGRIVTT